MFDVFALVQIINKFEELVNISKKRDLTLIERAAFRCCRCQNLGVDVHHIIPIRDGGSDDISNAAPLCQNCHDQFGANPEKRKQITRMRDWWYETCERLYSNNLVDLKMLMKIDEKLESIQQSQSGISELIEMLKELSDKSIDDITPATARCVTSQIVNTATATQLGEKVYAYFKCRNCGTWIGLLIGRDTCPNCIAKIT